MQFWRHQASAKAITQRLYLLFALAVLIVSSWIGLITSLIGGSFWTWSIITLICIVASSYIKCNQLRVKGSVLAEQIGATFIGEKPQDLAWLRFRNTATEMAIASRIVPPKLYVLENEGAVNAFAMGHTQKDAAIVVTNGMLQLLNRDELQGVIAHEMGHIVNGDIEINLRLMGLLHGILIIGRFGEMLIDIGALHNEFPKLSNGLGKISKKFDLDGLPPSDIPEEHKAFGFIPFFIGFFFLSLGYLGLAVGRLVKAAISRQRELLADASAAQFTRQSTSLANALKKMAALPQGTQFYDHATAEQFSHMLIMPGLRLMNLYASHPPILERIKRLDPSFNMTKLKFMRERLEMAQEKAE